MRRWAFALTVGVVAGSLVIFRVRVPEAPLDAIGLRAMGDSAFALGLTSLVLLVCGGFGLSLVGCLEPRGLTRLERVSFASALGLGALALGNLLLALLGWLTPLTLIAWLGALALLASIAQNRFLSGLSLAWTSLRSGWRELGPVEKLGIGIGVILLGFCVEMALVPTWDYDGLMYHLQAPRLILATGRLGLFPNLWQANGPLGLEMVYALGVSLHSDAFAKLIHLWFGLLLVLATVALGARVLGRGHAWMAGLLLLGVPNLPFWSSAAYTDVGWASFEALCLLALVAWLQEGGSRWLLLSGACLGLALGAKSLALLLIPIVALLILVGGRPSPRRWLADLAVGFAPAVIIGAPWYLKNLVLAGNPLYPLLWGGPEWPVGRVALLEAYLRSFGLGREPLDFLLLPVRVFLYPADFGTFARALESPNLLFVLAPAFLGVWRSRLPRLVGLVVLLRLALWSLGSQQTRFLLPMFPCLAVLAAGALLQITDSRFPRWLRLLPGTMVLTSILVVLGFAIAVPGVLRFHAVLLGAESRLDFLRRVGGDYRAVEFIQSNLPADARVLLMWDGRGYYCDERCLPDAEQSRWTWYVQRAPTVERMAALLREEGITHLFYGHGDAAFILEHDPTGVNRQAEWFFLSEFRRRCTRLLSSDPATEVYELTCPGDA